MIGAAVTATATATYVASGAVDRITIRNVGTGYKTSPQPLIGISSAPRWRNICCWYRIYI